MCSFILETFDVERAPWGYSGQRHTSFRQLVSPSLVPRGRSGPVMGEDYDMKPDCRDVCCGVYIRRTCASLLVAYGRPGPPCISPGRLCMEEVPKIPGRNGSFLPRF